MDELIQFKMDDIINYLKPTLIDTFVLFYGEKEREYITNKFNNTIFIGYISKDGYDRLNNIMINKNMSLPILDNEYVNERINEYNFLLPIDLNEVYNNHMTSFCPNCIKVEGELVEKNLLFFYGDRDLSLFDCTLIHECNHLYESSVEPDEEFIKVTSGWDSVSSRNEANPIRPYLELNEMINDYIAEDITKVIHEKGIYLLGKEFCDGEISDAEYANKSSFIIKEFYDLYKDIIIESRKKGNINRLFEMVGEENFTKLSNLVNEHVIWINSSSEEKTEEIIEAHYRDIMYRRDLILDNMNNYNKIN